MVAGNTTKSQFGKIALAGPVTNVILWILGFFAIILGIGENQIASQIIKPWMWGNAVLGTFNMIPFGPLDGRKIKSWSEIIFYTWAIICVSLIWFNIKHLNAII